jgi:hypothetical protein
MKYIYESPDGGKTVYRRPLNKPDATREIVKAPEKFHWEQEGIIIIPLFPPYIDTGA